MVQNATEGSILRTAFKKTRAVRSVFKSNGTECDQREHSAYCFPKTRAVRSVFKSNGTECDRKRWLRLSKSPLFFTESLPASEQKYQVY